MKILLLSTLLLVLIACHKEAPPERERMPTQSTCAALTGDSLIDDGVLILHYKSLKHNGTWATRSKNIN